MGSRSAKTGFAIERGVGALLRKNSYKCDEAGFLKLSGVFPCRVEGRLLFFGMIRILLVSFWLLSYFAVDAREFVSSDGRKIDGELVAHAGENVLIKVGAKEFSVPIQNFSLDDQQFIKEWIEQNPGAVRFKFGFFFDLEKESGMTSQGKAAGNMIDDKLKTIPLHLRDDRFQ
jgi:hypothetical protein